MNRVIMPAESFEESFSGKSVAELRNEASTIGRVSLSHGATESIAEVKKSVVPPRETDGEVCFTKQDFIDLGRSLGYTKVGATVYFAMPEILDPRNLYKRDNTGFAIKFKRYVDRPNSNPNNRLNDSAYIVTSLIGFSLDEIVKKTDNNFGPACREIISAILDEYAEVEETE